MKTNLKGEFKVAFPTTDKSNVDEHFGHCKYFAMHTIAENKIISTEYVEAPEHQPGVLPKFLGKLETAVIITGGMGKMAIDLFKSQDIEVILGAKGDIVENLNEYLGGNLDSSGEPCKHDHDHSH